MKNQPIKSLSIQPLETNRNGYEGWGTFAIRSQPQNVCVAVVGEVDRYHAAEYRALAYQMAAAPELLELLEDMTARSEMRFPHFEQGNGLELRERARALLARIALPLLFLFALTIPAAAQVFDTIMHYPEKAATAPKIFKEERLQFQEFADGTGQGVFKRTGAAWATSADFRGISVRVVQKDSLLLKFQTSVDWSDTIVLGRSNATDMGAVIYSTSKAGAERMGDSKKWYGWEVLISWPWDAAFLDRRRPFTFYLTFSRK